MKRWLGLLCLFSLYSSGSVVAAEYHGSSLTFSVLTYQVQSATPENLQLIGSKLNDFDIAGVQGCFARCESLLEASDHPNKYYFKDRPHWWNRANSGLASVSNFPLLEVKKLYYKAQANFVDENASKGLLLLRYNVNGHILDVYNTQMQPGQGQLDFAARQFQALELVQYVAAESPANHAVVLIGDFNMGETRPTIKAKLKLEDPAESLHGWFENQFDRVLYRSGSNTVFKPISWKDLSELFVDTEGFPLSASVPIAVQFSLE
ncbi:MAG TPA: endonuclease/exonuclease/phosphatase family protein [Oligoflexus sp.]|uniref:endonuclease/exonuclease/phosphatase family protein n=1 Tax=Oligoflexus sp. TaxID=1971216 RepID=UPI002D4EA497|nr:endonuclease/exonuclease/phosphatase family protein [Oligoflexus sp.]HYX34020.1 endonuclease/exonuclease/phosphatase family protein [Oligoflexus sp.]